MKPHALAVSGCVLKHAKSIMSEQDLLSIDVQGEFRHISKANCQDGGAVPQLNHDYQQLNSSGAISSSPAEGLLELAAQKLHGRRPTILWVLSRAQCPEPRGPCKPELRLESKFVR